MPISATATTEFDVDTQITLAMHMMGLLHTQHVPAASDLAMMRKAFWLGTTALANDGVMLRARERVPVSLVASQAYIDMAADTMSVEAGATLRDTTGTTERPISIYTMAEYQMLTTKGVVGVPTFYFPEKQTSGTFRVYLYPVPNGDFPTIIIPRLRKPRDMEPGNVTADVDTKYLLALNAFLSYVVARSKGRRDLASEMRQEYLDELGRAENDETERGPARFVIGDGPWD